MTASPPQVVFRNLAGHTLAVTWHPVGESYGGQCRLEGEVVNAAANPLLDAPGIHQPVGGPLTVTLPDGGTILHDFSTWRISVKPALGSSIVVP